MITGGLAAAQSPPQPLMLLSLCRNCKGRPSDEEDVSEGPPMCYIRPVPPGALRHAIRVDILEIIPFVNFTFQWGVVITTFLSILGIVPRRRARLTFLHPKLREIIAVLTTLKLLTLTLRAVCVSICAP